MGQASGLCGSSYWEWCFVLWLLLPHTGQAGVTVSVPCREQRYQAGRGAAPQPLLLLLLLMAALPSCLQGQPGPDPWPPLNWDSEGDLEAEQWPLLGTRLAEG